MHSECYAGVRLPALRHSAPDRTLYVTLILSIAAHLLFWHRLDLGTRPLTTTATDTPFSVTLLSTPVPQPTAHATPLHPSVTPKPREETLPLREESSASLNSEELSSTTQESVAATTAVVSEPLSPPRHDAAYLRNPEPGYPLVARRRHLEGTVVIRAQIGTDGACLHTELQRSSGHTILDQAALDAVGQWRFVPARRGSETVVAWVDVPITFHLTEAR